MTDKQIIIDGIDVSGCIYYQYNMCTATKDDYGDCSLCCQDYDMNDCYYKQLKRKEQECEELKKIINEAKNSNLDLKSFLVGEAVGNEYEQQLDQLKQTFAEIKDIVERDKLVCESCSERYTDGCTGYKDFENEGDCTHCGNGARADLAKQILQKISECEVEK